MSVEGQKEKPNQVVDNKEAPQNEEKKLTEIKDDNVLADNFKQEYTPDKLVIDKIDMPNVPVGFKSPVTEEFSYTKPLLSIKGMDLNDANISQENKEKILNAINSLGDFEKIKITGCTDANTINTQDGIQKNKSEFENIVSKFVAAGGEHVSYDELLKSTNDPQNTILGYRRAMEGVLSLNLTPDQMKKITISNKLGAIQDKEEGNKERGFDIDVDYSEKLTNEINGETTDFFYDFLGTLDLKSLGRYDNSVNHSYGYNMNSLDLKTHFDPDNPTELYTRVMGNLPSVLATDVDMQQKVQTKTASYLRNLINTCGGEYNNGVWSAKALTRKQYYTIVATHDKLISNQDFSSIMNKDSSVLENKQLESGKTIKDLLEENKDNPIKGVGNETRGIYRYYVEDGGAKSPKERVISKNDYILLGLYFQMKNS